QLIASLASRSEAESSSAATKLVQRGAEAVPALLRTFANADDFEARRVVLVLGQIGDHRAKSAIMDALDRRDTKLVAIAVSALGALGEADAIPRIGGLLQSGPAEVRRAAASALASIAVPDAVPFLSWGLLDDDPWVRTVCQDSFLATP